MTYFAEIAALSYEDREIVAQVMADAVPLMTDRQRDCLRMYLGGMMTQADIGARLGITQQAASKQLAQALGVVKRCGSSYVN